MKWKNIDIGACYYYITGTCTQWLPLFNNPAALRSFGNLVPETSHRKDNGAGRANEQP